MPVTHVNAEAEPVRCDLVVVLPVYDDSEALTITLGELDSAMEGVADNVVALAVDDGSLEPVAIRDANPQYKHIREVRCVRLKGNVGHQRAIAIGLSYAYHHFSCEAVIVMDADGEDRAEDAARLVERFRERKGLYAIFAERSQRSEGLVFGFCYLVYRLMVRLLSGHRVRVGNFSIISREHMGRLMISADLWNHYAATVLRARVPRESIPTNRGNRLAGKSKMNFVALLTHGLCAISVFTSSLFVRILLGAGILTTLAFIGAIACTAIPVAQCAGSWLVITAWVVFAYFSQVSLFALVLALLVLSERNKEAFLPARDYVFFVTDVRSLYPDKT